MSTINFKSAFGGMALAALALLAAPAQASWMRGAVSATTTMGEEYPLVHAIDQSGLSAAYVSGVTDFDAFVATTTHTSNPDLDWVSTSTSGSVTFNLGSIYTIDRLAVWNFGTGTGTPEFAIRDIELWSSTDGIAFTSLGSFSLTNPGGAPSTLAQVLFAPTTAGYFRMDVLSTYGANAALGEVAFSQVPAPGSLVLVGAGLLAFTARRRRAQA